MALAGRGRMSGTLGGAKGAGPSAAAVRLPAAVGQHAAVCAECDGSSIADVVRGTALWLQEDPGKVDYSSIGGLSEQIR